VAKVDPTGASPAGARLDRSTVLALVAMALGVFVIANDFTALSVAIPEIESDLETNLNRAQWVINGYAVVFGVLIVTGGRLADQFGRRRIFMLGASLFAVFSLLGGLAPDIELLIACRAAMGIGGAMMWPAVLGMTYAILPDSRASLAGSLILGVAGMGNAIGPLIGGALTEGLSWRWVFFLNVPIAAFAMFVTARTVPEDTGAGPEAGIDYQGIATLSAGVIAILVALDQGTADGYGSPAIVALLVVGVLLLGVFVRVERRQGANALVPPDVMRHRQFVVACAVVLLMSAIFFAALLYLPQFMEKELAFSAVEAGAGLLPLMVVFAAMSFASGKLYDKFGARTVVSAGAAFLGLGILMLSFLDGGWDYAALVPGMVVLGAGVGLFYSSITTAAVTSLDPSRSSLAGGIVYMCQVAGGALGLGINTALVLSQSDLPDGIRLAFRVDAALAAVGLVVALAFIGRTEALTHRHDLRWHHRAHA
jgi:EmrB/QacA subfamily drug resistance transporter